MATANDPSPRRSPSRDHILSNITGNLQSNCTVDRAPHRAANGAGEYPYSSSNVRGHVSAGDLHEHAAGANSATDSDQLSSGLPLNAPLHATTTGPLRQIVTNDRTSNEPPLGEKAGSGPPQAEKVSPRGTNPNSSKPLAVDPPSLAQTPAIVQDVRPPPPKDPLTSELPLPPPAPRMTTAHSRRTQELAPGGPQAPLGRQAPPNASAIPNKSRETAHSDMTGGHGPLNGQLAPTNVSSPVRHSSAKEVPSLPIITLNAYDQSCLLYISHRHLPLPPPNTVPQLFRRLLLHD
jgi:hypothetical protein